LTMEHATYELPNVLVAILIGFRAKTIVPF
jgi:hypothetical protein